MAELSMKLGKTAKKLISNIFSIKNWFNIYKKIFIIVKNRVDSDRSELPVDSYHKKNTATRIQNGYDAEKHIISKISMISISNS